MSNWKESFKKDWSKFKDIHNTKINNNIIFGFSNETSQDRYSYDKITIFTKYKDVVLLYKYNNDFIDDLNKLEQNFK